MYCFETKDIEMLKELFSNLSNHKPIFADDRLGRRMTLEKTFNFKVSPQAQPESPIRMGQNRYTRVHPSVHTYSVVTWSYIHFSSVKYNNWTVTSFLSSFCCISLSFHKLKKLYSVCTVACNFYVMKSMYVLHVVIVLTAEEAFI